MVARAEQDVRRLDVSVDEPAGVRDVERGRHLSEDADRSLRVERAPVGEHGAQVLAVDEAHHLEQDAVLFSRPVDRDHVGVVERSRGSRLRDEPAPERGVLGVRRGVTLTATARSRSTSIAR